jgi:pectate lyase
MRLKPSKLSKWSGFDRVLTSALFLLGPAVSGGAATYYVATNGLDTNPGTSNSPFATITRAQAGAAFGDTVYLRGGTYFLNNSHLTATNNPWAIVNNLTKSGISYVAVPGERPIFNFSGVQPIGYRVTAFLVTSSASDCVFKGFEVVGVTINVTGVNSQSECFRVTGGNRNRFEQLVMRDGMGIGWYLTSGQSNLVLNCDAYNNRGLDSFSLGNIDGFGIHGTSTSHTGNVLRGCRAWFNSDDGFDLINCKAPAVIENCWAFYNGYFTNFASSGGDANGFKSGGYGVSGASYPIPVPRHVTRFSLAVRNRASGFYANHHPGGLDWFNNTAYRNARNFNMLCNVNALGTSNDVPGFDHVMKNNLGYKATVSEVANLGATNDTTFNYFTLPVTVATNDFMSLDESLLTAPRQTNGDLPYLAFAQLVGNSDLRDAGTNAGFAFAGVGPDLGAFEYALHPPPPLTLTRAGADLIFTGSGGPAGGTNYLVATSNLALPVSQWPRVATNQFDLRGNFNFTNARSVGVSQQFHRLQLP